MARTMLVLFQTGMPCFCQNRSTHVLVLVTSTQLAAHTSYYCRPIPHVNIQCLWTHSMDVISRLLAPVCGCMTLIGQPLCAVQYARAAAMLCAGVGLNTRASASQTLPMLICHHCLASTACKGQCPLPLHLHHPPCRGRHLQPCTRAPRRMQHFPALLLRPRATAALLPLHRRMRVLRPARTTQRATRALQTRRPSAVSMAAYRTPIGGGYHC